MYGQFIAAGACASPALESAEEILNPVTNSIVTLRVAHFPFAVRLPWNAVTVTERLKFTPQFVTVETFVSDQQHRRVLILEQFDDMSAFIGLSRDQLHAQSPAFEIGNDHQFGVSSASGLAHGLGFRPSPGIGRALMRYHVRAIHQPAPAAFSFNKPSEHPVPKLLPRPLTVVSINRLPRAKLGGQVAPRTGISQTVKHRLDYDGQRTRRAPAGTATIFRSRFLSRFHQK